MPSTRLETATDHITQPFFSHPPPISDHFLRPLSPIFFSDPSLRCDLRWMPLFCQVCVAYTGQVLPIWVHKTSLIALRVVSVEAPGYTSSGGDGPVSAGVGQGGGSGPTGCVRLTADTEVAVLPKPRRPRRRRSGEGEGDGECESPPALSPSTLLNSLYFSLFFSRTGAGAVSVNPLLLYPHPRS